MPDDQLSLLQQAQTAATNLLSSKLSKSIKFHTLEHTQEVVMACEILAKYDKIPDADRLALGIAAWFHDTGYTGGDSKDHETLSIRLATNFLNEYKASDELKNKVIGCINATRMPQNPTNDLEKMICDADLFHLGTDGFEEKSKLLRQELNEFGDNNVSKKDWRKINIRFLERHEYFTMYGKENLEPVKARHLAGLLKKEDEKNQETMKPEKKDKDKDKPKDKGKDPAEAAAADELKKKREREKEADRSIATVFRIMAQSHTGLSQMADSKANILISVNAIILSIMIGSLFDKLDTNTFLKIPVTIIAVVCVASIVFGILATRPNVTSGTFTRDDIAAKKTNLLFFGNFHNMSLEDYNWGMNEMLVDKYYMNNSMIKDNYFLGVVLAKKYRYLRIAYNIFMYGLIIAVVAFALSYTFLQEAESYT
jgi:predicted metal-dependent HD superfamily phosphohydrolase